jgi:hypothetical protein
MTYLDPRYKSSLIEAGLQPSGMMAPPTIYNLNYSANTQTITPDLIYGNALYRINIIIPSGSVVPNPAIIVEFSDNVLKQLFGNVCIIYFYIELLTGTFDPSFPKFQLIIRTENADSESISFFPTKQSDTNICTYALLIDTSFDPNAYNSSLPYNRIYPINGLNKASQFRK